MKQHVIVIFCLVFIVVAFFLFIANTPWALSLVLPSLVENSLKDVGLKTLHIQKQRFVFPDTLRLYGIKSTVQQGEKKYVIQASHLVLYDIIKIWRARQQIKASAFGLNVELNDNAIQNADLRMILRLRGNEVQKAEGIINKANIFYQKYLFKNTSARFIWNREKLEVFEIFTQIYGGTAYGQFTCDYFPSLSYVVWMEFADCQPEGLLDMYPEFFSKIKGGFSGNMRIVGSQETTDLLAIEFSLKNGAIHDSLLTKVIEDIADANKRTRFQALLKNAGYYPVDRALLHIGKAGNKTTATFSITNQEDNLYLKEILSTKNIGAEIDQVLLRK